MSSLVTAMYDTRDVAEHAAKLLMGEATLAHVSIFDGSRASMEALRSLGLTPEERRTCERNLAGGGYLLLAQAKRGESPHRIIAALEHAGAGPNPGPERSAPPAPGPPSEERSQARTEERIPLVEEELRIGTREVARGGARVRTRVEAVPVAKDTELLEEFVRAERRSVTRRISEHEIEAAGLLRDRVIEIAQVREEAVVSKEAFVREEVVLTKTTERRVEQVRQTVRHTEFDVEDLGQIPPPSGVS